MVHAEHHQLSTLNGQLGGAPLPAFDPFHTLFVCLLGSIVLVWSLLRLRAPSVALGRHDGAARLLFSLWMVWALNATGAPLLWLFVVPECAWGVAQLLLSPRLPKNQEQGPMPGVNPSDSAGTMVGAVGSLTGRFTSWVKDE
ncbi:MAG: hypothetical protein JWQ01_4161 [Massilia sp.]|nr:hypothetical protein [Massilia sp.]